MRVIATLRADFYDRPLMYPRIGDLPPERTEAVHAAHSRRARAGIVGPAERVGLDAEPGLGDRDGH